MLSALILRLHDCGYSLSDGEACAILPPMIEMLGHKDARFVTAVRCVAACLAHPDIVLLSNAELF